MSSTDTWIIQRKLILQEPANFSMSDTSNNFLKIRCNHPQKRLQIRFNHNMTLIMALMDKMMRVIWHKLTGNKFNIRILYDLICYWYIFITLLSSLLAVQLHVHFTDVWDLLHTCYFLEICYFVIWVLICWELWGLADVCATQVFVQLWVLYVHFFAFCF